MGGLFYGTSATALTAGGAAIGGTTTAFGISDIAEGATGHNFIQDYIYGGNATAYYEDESFFTMASGMVIGYGLYGSLIEWGEQKANTNLGVSESNPDGQESNSIYQKGKKAFENFDVKNAYVKPKHLSTTGGNGAKFLGDSKSEAESILVEAIKNGNIQSILDNGMTSQGNQSYEIIIDAGKIIGTRGETFIKIILSEDGGMLSAFPVN